MERVIMVGGMQKQCCQFSCITWRMPRTDPVLIDGRLVASPRSQNVTIVASLRRIGLAARIDLYSYSQCAPFRSGMKTGWEEDQALPKLC